MKGATWFSEKNEFTLDYVCVNDSALKCVESAYILERREVVESDHGAVTCGCSAASRLIGTQVEP